MPASLAGRPLPGLLVLPAALLTLLDQPQQPTAGLVLVAGLVAALVAAALVVEPVVNVLRVGLLAPAALRRRTCNGEVLNTNGERRDERVCTRLWGKI